MFGLQPTWLSGLTTSFQSVLTASNNAYASITTFNTFRTTVSQTYQTISGFSSFQNQVNTAIDNIKCSKSKYPKYCSISICW
jgi:ABC-type polysaccharide/polyol phosphate transport system ATPase subunit